MMQSGASCRSNLAETLTSMGYRFTESDPDVWIKRATTYNCTTYYKYMLVYVNDVLHLVKGAQEDMLKLNQVFILREFLQPLDRYLNLNVDKVQLKDVIPVWYMPFVEYLCGYIKEVDSILERYKVDLKYFGYVHCPHPSSYRT